MSNTNKNLVKLQESFKERDEAKVCLSKYFLVHQHNLPQEIINAWVEFERLEREAQTIEAEALKGIEREIDVLENKKRERKKLLGFSDRVFVVLFILVIAGRVTMDLIVPHFFVIGEPYPFNDYSPCPGAGFLSC